MRRITTFILALLLSVSAFAQSPKEILESFRKYPNLAMTVGSTYPSVPLGEIAAAPEGFEPFYFSLTGRHGSRYELKDRYFKKALDILNCADSLGILTKDGKLLLKRVKEVYDAQQGNHREISFVGMEQWQKIAERAYNNFGKVFESGSIEAKSSTSMRCVLSMISFNYAMKGKVPTIKIWQNSRVEDLALLRPLADSPEFPEEVRSYLKEAVKEGKWNEELKAWVKSRNVSDFLSKVSTDPYTFGKKCGEKYPFNVARYIFTTLLFGENFGTGDRELLNRLFTAEELYGFYIYKTASWVNGSIGRGNEYAEARQAYMRPLIEDILNKAEAAIKGENPDVANLRFTHDSYMGPLFSVMGYEGCVPQWNENLELAASSFNHGMVVPMASNLQLILYRDKQGKVYVRSLINERDGYISIKCKSAPFYPWKDFCKYVNDNLNYFDISKNKVLKKMGK
jgi:hypothetical protein